MNIETIRHISAGGALELVAASLGLLLIGLWLTTRRTLSREARWMGAGVALVGLGHGWIDGYWLLASWTAEDASRIASWAARYQPINWVPAQVFVAGVVLIGYGVLHKAFGRLWWQAPAALAALIFLVGMAGSAW